MRDYIRFSCFIVFSFCCERSFAQKSIDLGIKGGLSVPNLTAGSSSNPINSGYSSRLGADAAVHAEFHLTSHFSIQPQLEYSEQGGKKNGNQAFAVPAEMVGQFPAGQAPSYLYADYKSVAKINYLMLPVLAKYRFDLGGGLGGYAAAGPFVSLLVSAKNITSGSSIVYLDEQHTEPISPTAQSFDNTENIKSDLHAFNTGISGHIGIDYKLFNGKIFFEAGGNYGFIDIQKDGANGKNRAGAAAINLGYQFNLCKCK